MPQVVSIDSDALVARDARMATDRLELEPIRREHAADLFSVLGDPSLYEYTFDTPPASLAALRDRYSRLESRQSPDGTEKWLSWVLVEVATGMSIGYVQATVNANGADIAWVVGRPWQRRGFATEAARGLVVWLRCAGVRVIRAKIKPMHTASEQVAANAGLSRTHEMIDGEVVWVRRI